MKIEISDNLSYLKAICQQVKFSPQTKDKTEDFR